MKRIAKLLLLAAFAALLAPTAQAAEYQLAVAGRQVTDANKDDILGDGGSVRFSLTGTNGTLTLSNAAITNVLGGYSNPSRELSGIVAVDAFALTIVLEGSNVVKAVPNTGIYANDMPLTITGGGSLWLVPNQGLGIVTEGDLTIDGVTVSAGASRGGGIECAGNLTITNAVVTASIRGDSRNGIECQRLSIGGASRLEATTAGTGTQTGKRSALWFKNGIEIGDGLVVLEPSPYWIEGHTVHAEGDSGEDGALRVVIGPPVAYPLWVGGTQVTSANATNILGDGTAWFEGTATNGTLSLSNAVVTNAVVYDSGASYSAGIFAGNGFDLAISLDGSNRVANAKEHGYGIRANGNLSLGGAGSLTAESGIAGIYSDGNLRIENTTVTASGSDGLRIDGNIVLTNATVSATGRFSGIYTYRAAAFSGESRVEATASDGEAVYAVGGITVGAGLDLVEPDGGGLEANGQQYFVDAGGNPVQHVLLEPSVVAYDLWVGSTQVTSDNKDNILGDGTARFESSASGGTLYLSNARITEAIEYSGTDTAGIYSGEGFDLTISLAGSNRVESAGSTTHDYCVYARANLAITGEGTLVAEIPNGNACGIGGHADLRIDGATVTVSAGDTGLLFGNTLAISNATVTATGTSNYGIYCSGFNGRIDIADSVVTATGGSKGLYARGTGSSLAVSGSSVVTAVTTSDDNVAFSAAALVLGDGLAVTEPAGGVFGEDGSGSGCVIDPATGAPAKRVVIDRRFAVTVEGGSTTNTTARAGETVTVVANAPEEGKAFVEWSADDAMDLSFATAAATTTTFAMPARAVTVTAVFKEIQIDSIPDQEWTGGPVEPEFRSDTVKFEGTDMVLLPGTDYTVSYTNNVDPGTATATVTMAPPRTGHASATFQILPPPVPPSVSNVVARQRWPWNGFVDVDYEVGGDTNLLAGVTARITFEERIEGGTGRIWVASNFLAGAEPSVEPGPHRATWDTAADGVTGVVAAVKATVNLVGTGNEKGLELVSKIVIVTPVDPDSDPSCVEVNGNGYLLTNDPKGVVMDLRFGSGRDSAKLGDVVGITLDADKAKKYFESAESLQLVPSEGIKLVDPATGDKVDSLEVSADGSVTLFVTADQVVPGGSITVHGNGKTVVIDNINFYDSVPEGWVGVVVTSAASAEFRLDTREGPLPSDGTETLAYSTLWHPAGDATVTILQDGEEEPVAAELAGEGDIVWQVFEDGTYTLTHKTMASDATVSAEETATFVVTGHPPVEAALRWKYAKNANGWHCAQVALKWHPSFAREISDMRLLFADRYEDEEPLAVIKTLDDEQAAFFPDFRLIKLAGEDGKYYFVDDGTGKVYTESFVERGYREKLDERPTVVDGDEAGTVSGWGSSINSDSYITNGVLNAAGTGVSFELTVNGTPTLQLKFASSPHGLGRRTAYLVDPATVIDPLGTTETYRDVEYRVAPVDLTAFAGLADGARAVYGVSDATMASSLDSVPKAERKICLRVVNRDYSTVGWVDNKLAILAWNVGGSPRFLPIAETMASLRDDDDDPQPAPRPAPRPLSVAEANLSASFGLAPAAVARGAVTCRVSSMSFGEDGSVEGTFAVAAENAGGVVAESGELAGNVKLTVLGAERLGGAFEPLDPKACGVELLSRRAPFAFRVKAPGDNAFFKVRLTAEDRYE